MLDHHDHLKEKVYRTHIYKDQQEIDNQLLVYIIRNLWLDGKINYNLQLDGW